MRQAQRGGDVAAGAAQGVSVSLEDARDGIVAAGLDFQVVHQDGGGQGSQPPPRFGVLFYEGFFVGIAAGDDQGGGEAGGAFQKEMVQGGVGEHHAQGVLGGGHFGRDGRIGAAFQHDDGTLGGVQQVAGGLSHAAELFCCVHLPDDDGKGFVGAAFAAAEFRYRLGVCGVAQQAVAPRVLDGDDAALGDKLAGFFYSGSTPQRERVPLSGDFEPHLRAAGLTGDGVGVVTAVCGVVVFPRAGFAHLEGRHSGVAALVGSLLQNAEARAAVGARDEGVAVTPVGGVEEFFAAVFAEADIRRERLKILLVACRWQNLKGEGTTGGDLLDADGVYVRQGRGLLLNELDEAMHGLRRSLHGDVGSRGGRAYPPAHAQTFRQIVHKGAETDAFQEAVYVDVEALQVAHGEDWYFRRRCPLLPRLPAARWRASGAFRDTARRGR